MVARNDEFFDFDVFQDLDLLQPVDESCVSTRLTTTTNAPPTDYCNTIRISGSENHYGAVGTYHKSGTLNGKNKVGPYLTTHSTIQGTTPSTTHSTTPDKKIFQWRMGAGWEVAYNSGGQYVLYFGDINAAIAKVSLFLF